MGTTRPRCQQPSACLTVSHQEPQGSLNLPPRPRRPSGHLRHSLLRAARPRCRAPGAAPPPPAPRPPPHRRRLAPKQGPQSPTMTNNRPLHPLRHRHGATPMRATQTDHWTQPPATSASHSAYVVSLPIYLHHHAATQLLLRHPTRHQQARPGPDVGSAGPTATPPLRPFSCRRRSRTHRTHVVI